MDVPAALDQLIQGAVWQRNEVGHSNTEVFRLQRPDDALYLKIATDYDAFELQGETARLRWMHAHALPVPEVLYANEHDGKRYLLMTEANSVTLIDKTLYNSPETIVRVLAEGMKLLHSIPIDNCPFNHQLAERLPLARMRVEKGLIDEDDFDDERQGYSAKDLYSELLRDKPTSEDLVFTHGDYCLPNILLDPKTETISGFIDLGRAGIADRHQDIALCTRSLTYNLGDGWTDLLYDLYGISYIDEDKIEYYKLLDEFF